MGTSVASARVKSGFWKTGSCAVLSTHCRAFALSPVLSISCPFPNYTLTIAAFPRRSVGFFSVDLDIDESLTGVSQGTAAASIVTCGLLYTLMGLTCQKGVKELMIVEYKMVKRGLLDTPNARSSSSQSLYTAVSEQPVR